MVTVKAGHVRRKQDDNSTINMKGVTSTDRRSTTKTGRIFAAVATALK